MKGIANRQKKLISAKRVWVKPGPPSKPKKRRFLGSPPERPARRQS